MISALFLIAGIHSTTNLKTCGQAKKIFNPANTQSFSEKSHKVNVHEYWLPFHLVQYPNSEFMS